MSNENQNQIKGFLRVSQVIKLLGIGKSTFYKWIADGRFSRGIRLGERIKVWKSEEIYAFMDKAAEAAEVKEA